MVFQKGEVSNPNGRPKGAKNKSTLHREDIARLVLESIKRRGENTDTDNFFDTLDAKQLADIAKAAMPKESKIDLNTGQDVLDSINEKLNSHEKPVETLKLVEPIQTTPNDS